MNAALVLAASHWMTIGGSKTDVISAYYHHKVEAIHIINKTLVDKESAICDSNLAAIALLAIADVSTSLQMLFASMQHLLTSHQSTEGSSATARMHLAGLERLVKMRSQVHSEEMTPLLQRLVHL